MDYDKNISFKKVSNEDIPLLVIWFSEPHVNTWWPLLNKEEVIEHFLKRIRSKNTFGYIVNFDDKPIGYIQYYYIDPLVEKTGRWLPDLPKGTVGTDQFIGDLNYIGKGIGTRMIKEFIAYICTLDPDIPTVIVDPDPTNDQAIRCYERVGFKRIGIFETSYGFCLLMKYDVRIA